VLDTSPSLTLKLTVRIAVLWIITGIDVLKPIAEQALVIGPL